MASIAANPHDSGLGPTSRDKEARIRSMVEAAIKLFSEESYAEVSTRRVAELAGCSETLLFRYFGDKRGLLTAICNEMYARGSSLPNADEFEDLEDYIRTHLQNEFEQMRRNGPVVKVVAAALVSESELSTDFERRHDEAVETVATQLRRFQRRGAVAPDVDVHAIATAIEQMAFAVGLLMQVIYDRPGDEVDSIARTFAKTLAVGLQGRSDEPFSEAQRREARRSAARAQAALDVVIDLLDDSE